MRIAFIFGRFPVISEPFILNQISGLVQRGHEVDIYALMGPPIEHTDKVHPDVERYQLLERTYYPPERPQAKWLRPLKAWALILANLHKNSLACLRMRNPKYGNTAKSWKLFFRAFPFLGKKPYDIIHCQFGPFGVMGMQFRDAGLLQGKLITTFRGFDVSRYVQEQGEDVYNELFEQGDFFLANCEFFRQKVIQLGCSPESIVVHGSGIDCSSFSFKPRFLPADGSIRIATTGRLVEKKGIEYVIRAIAQVARQHRNIEYHIIGDGPLKESFQTLIRELEIQPVVILHGWKDQREIIEILDRCHLFVAPSVTAADGNQDAPVNTLKEAMAMGLPVVSTYHGGIPELVEDGVSGFLVPEQDAGAIAEKLTYLIKHPEIWTPFGRAGRTKVEEKYEINKLNNELFELYQVLVNSEVPRADEDSVTEKKLSRTKAIAVEYNH